MRVRFWKSTTDHIDEFLHVFDITHELIMTFFFGGFGMELVLREERVDELPIGTIRNIDTSDRAEFCEITLRIVELLMSTDIIEVGILDDLLEVGFWLREEDCRHDDPLDLVDTEFRMLV